MKPSPGNSGPGSRAELLARAIRADGSLEATAELFGFERVHRRADAEEPETAGTPASIPSTAAASDPTPGVELDSEVLRFPFLLAVECESIVLEEPERPAVHPITSDEIRIDWQAPAFRLPSLMPWPRLGTHLRRRLGRWTPGRRLDLRRLLDQVARARPLHDVPRLGRLSWTSELVVLRDPGEDLYPFHFDVEALLTRLRRERGTAGLRVLEFPSFRSLPPLPPGAPVLALSDLGQYEFSGQRRAEWLALARSLASRGHSLHALVPCPRGQWSAALATAWNAVLWDRKLRPPRQGGHDPLPAPASLDDGRDTLLAALSPASRVDAPLLRTARLALAQAADVGTEHAAFFHPTATWRSLGCFGPGRTMEMESRQGLNPDLLAGVDEAILAQMARYSPAKRFETELRILLSRSPTPDSPGPVPDEMVRFFDRVVRRLEELAEEPSSEIGVQSGIPNWFEGMVVERLPASIRSHPAIQSAISRGLALADRWLEKTNRPEIPAGVDLITYRRELESKLPAAEARDYDLRWQAGTFGLSNASPIPGPAGSIQGRFRATPGRPVYIIRRDAEGRERQLKSPPRPDGTPMLIQPRRNERLTLLSDQQRLVFAAVERPDWAEEMGMDAYGVWSLFTVDGVSFRLRWIPAGAFVMGSPPDEPGRFESEGPQHRVTIRQGFWLGETQVTQAQWRAVAKASSSTLDRSPSHFRGPEDLPVENVSWGQCELFHNALKNLVPGLPFRFPSEAEWEYACRAGSTTALPTGPINILGKRNAPALESIAWYGGNSGLDLEVENPVTSGWRDQQYPHKQAGTHRVGLKMPNAWGLYDMIGNGWQWCMDDKREFSEEVVENPIGSLDTSHRVVRGGAWFCSAFCCRSASRSVTDRDGAEDREGAFGLRLASSPDPAWSTFGRRESDSA